MDAHTATERGIIGGMSKSAAFDPLALDLRAASLAVIAGILAFRFHRSLIEVVVVMAALGIAMRYAFG